MNFPEKFEKLQKTLTTRCKLKVYVSPSTSFRRRSKIKRMYTPCTFRCKQVRLGLTPCSCVSLHQPSPPPAPHSPLPAVFLYSSISRTSSRIGQPTSRGSSCVLLRQFGRARRASRLGLLRKLTPAAGESRAQQPPPAPTSGVALGFVECWPGNFDEAT